MQRTKKTRVIFTGGGTGGHVFPGLALIEELRDRTDWEILWMGSSGGMERRLVKEFGLPFLGVPSGKLRRYFSFRNFLDLFLIGAGFLASLWVLLRFRPLFLFSKGGYVTVPPVWAARFLRIPVYSHESDLDPGLATRLNMGASRRIFCAYPQSVEHFPEGVRPRIQVTGNPVRRGIARGDRDRVYRTWPLDRSLPLILVLGGSSGARQLNQLTEGLVPLFRGRAVFVHQTGNEGCALESGPGYMAAPFFGPELPDLLAAATVLISRAGAGSLWEMACVELPGILVPLGEGSRGDQVRNAELFEKAGAALVLRGTPQVQDLEKALQSLLTDSELRARVKTGLRTFSAAGAARSIVDSLLDDFASTQEAARV